MKKIFLVALLGSSLLNLNANVEDNISIENLVKSIYSVEKDNKDACLKFEQDFINDKFSLMQKQNDELYELNYRGIDQLRRIDIDTMLKDKAPKKIELLDKHLDEWKALCQKHHQAGEAMYRAAKQRLANVKGDSPKSTAMRYGMEESA